MRYYQLMKQFGPYCFYCGIKVVKPRGEKPKSNWATVDHVIPRSKGGTRSDDNSVLACYRCNTLKGNKTLEEFEAELQRGLA